MDLQNIYYSKIEDIIFGKNCITINNQDTYILNPELSNDFDNIKNLVDDAKENKNLIRITYKEKDNKKWINKLSDIDIFVVVNEVLPVLRYIVPFNHEETDQDQSKLLKKNVPFTYQNNNAIWDLEIKTFNFKFFPKKIGFLWFEVEIKNIWCNKLQYDIYDIYEELIALNRTLRVLNFSNFNSKNIENNTFTIHLGEELKKLLSEEELKKYNIEFRRTAQSTGASKDKVPSGAQSTDASKDKVPSGAHSFIYMKNPRNKSDNDKNNYIYSLVHGTKSNKDNLQADVLEPLASSNVYANKYGFAYVNWWSGKSKYPYYDLNLMKNYFDYYLDNLYNYYLLENFVKDLHDFVKALENAKQDDNVKTLENVKASEDVKQDKDILEKISGALREIALFMTDNTKIDSDKKDFEEEIYDYLRKQLKIDYYEDLVSKKVGVVDAVCERLDEAAERKSEEERKKSDRQREMALTTIGALAIFSAVCDGIDIVTDKAESVVKIAGEVVEKFCAFDIAVVVAVIVVLYIIYRLSKNLIKFIWDNEIRNKQSNN